MAVRAITQRHVRELALAWWRHETSPMLLARGTLAEFADIERRMEAYLDGAALDSEAALDHLRATWNPASEDCLADVVAGMMVIDAAQPTAGDAVTADALPGATLHAQARQSVSRWAGASDTHDASLRFIDATGVVRGHFLHDQPRDAHLGDAPAPAELCTFVLRHPEQARSVLESAIGRGDDPAVVFLAASLTGDAALLDWLLHCAAQPELTALALDAFRRITGFDALAAAGLDKTLVASMRKEPLRQAHQLAAEWLPANLSRLPSGQSLLGRPTEVQHLIEALRSASQADREIAAMFAPELHGFPVRARASVQRARLEQLSH
jgi:hypothetical protein